MKPTEMSVFPIGNTNDVFAKYFIGQSYLNMLSTEQVVIGNVTFEPKSRNNWHVHHADHGGGQMLLVTAGEGWYQEWEQKPRKLKPGDVVHIPAGVKHWHGASADSWFQHLAMEVPGENCKTEWCEPVSDNEYENLEKEV
ncbi:cupin domain-containing protein [Lacrimispora brassicae]